MLQRNIMSDSLYISEIFSSIQGEGMLAGRRQIFIRLTECNLNCSYCDTDFEKSDVCHLESEPGNGAFIELTQPITLHKLIAIIEKWILKLPAAHHSISLTGGEPLIHSEILTDWLPSIKNILPIHLETNGILTLALHNLKQHLDYISMDIKLPSTSGCNEHLWESHEAFLNEASDCNVSVKVVIGNNTTNEEIINVCNIISSVNPSFQLFLQPVTVLNGKIGVKADRILQLQALASSFLPNVMVIPQMHKLLGAL